MATISGDQIVFLVVAAILLFCYGNTHAVLKKTDLATGEKFWLWGLISLAISYFGFGLSAWFGRSSLIVANLGFLSSYVFLVLQLRFWTVGQSNIPKATYFAIAAYLILFEVTREFFPYVIRATLGQFTIFVLAGYLAWTAIFLYQKWRSSQILILASTFAIEAICAVIRISMLWIQPESTSLTTSVLSEPFYMVVIRWVWALANAMSYLTLMTIILEKAFNRNDELQLLVKEKRQLISAMGKVTRSHHAGYMASALTHELAQPLAVLHLLSQSLSIQLKEKNIKSLEDQINLLRNESERCAKIMQQMDSLLRVRNADLQPLSISNIVKQALKILSLSIKEKNIAVHENCIVDCTVNAEPTQLELVFLNIISNAIVSMSDQSESRFIEIGCDLIENNCVITIKDNGPGIDLVILQNIGQLYMSDRTQGTGMGLWLSNLIITSHQGKLEAENNASGGALFKITLPAIKN